MSLIALISLLAVVALIVEIIMKRVPYVTVALLVAVAILTNLTSFR